VGDRRLTGRRGGVTRRVDLLGIDEVPDGTMKMAYVDGVDAVVVVHSGGEIRAFQGICTHEYFELDKGFLTGGGSVDANGLPGGTLTCALHLSRFDLATGEALDPPAELPLAAYPVVVADGRILIDIPDGPLPVNE
jgi:3-phenylpropionate/trans-cinnamate dioxygenase ferredoxin subunit